MFPLLIWSIAMGTFLNMSANESSEARAKITILALQASARSMEAPNDATWVVDGRSHALEEVIRILELRRKPIACDARAQGSRLVLHLREITDSVELLHWQSFQSKSFESMTRVLRDRYGDIRKDAVIDVRWSDESIILPIRELRQWFLDYRIEFLIQSVEDVDDAAKSSGAVAIMRLGSVRGITLRIEAR